MASHFADHFSGHSELYAKYRPRYPKSLFDYLASKAPSRALAWDVATGSGQAAFALTEHFDSVYATDASAAQMSHAISHPKIQYVVEPAETSSLEDATVDLVVVAQALHWFDSLRFFEEVQRVLRPGGVWSCWCYTLCSISPPIDEQLLEFYEQVIGPYWPPERYILEQGYRNIDIPLTEWVAPSFHMTAHWTREEFLGYLRTWSACQRYLNATGVDPVTAFADQLKSWPDFDVREIRFPLAIRMGCR